jgi:hypothetical protein
MATQPSCKVSKPPGSRVGSVILTVFGLPFLGVGLFACLTIVGILRDWQQIRQWSPTEARIVSVDLRSHRGSKGSTTYEVRCAYEYSAGGQTHHSERVGLEAGADNIGSWHQDKFAYLKEKYDAGQPVTCLVDPADPRRAVLFGELRPATLIFWGCFAVVFTAAGGGMVGGGVASWRAAGRRRRAYRQYPDQPWMWEPRWADGLVRSGGWLPVVGVWLICIFWNGISWAAAAFVLMDVFADNGSHAALLVLLFPAVGLLLLAAAVYVTIGRMKYGHSELRLGSMPIWIGGRLQGEALLRGAVTQVSEVQLGLCCVRSVTHGAGKSRHTDKTTLWKAEQVQTAEPAFDGRGLTVAVDFAIPQECSPWDDSDSNDKVEWNLNVKADVPGVNVNLDFPVPVFAGAPAATGLHR